jgi:hypothetical protein
MAVNAATTGMTVQSVQKMMNEFGNIVNPRVTISMTLKNRRIGDSVFDYNDYDIGMLPGQTFNKGAYMGFEQIIVKSVFIQPYTDLIIVNQNRFLRKTIIHNGTPFPQQHNFTFIKPFAFSMYVMDAVSDGKFKVHDGCKWLDSRIWSIIGIVSFVVIMVVLIVCTSGNSTEAYEHPVSKSEYVDTRRAATITDLSKFNRLRVDAKNYVK